MFKFFEINSIRNRMVTGFLFLTFLILVLAIVSLSSIDHITQIARSHSRISQLEINTLSLIKYDNDFFDLETIITTDHGRGPDPENWKHHGIKTAESDQIWMAVLGPDTKPLGEVKTSGQLYQKQVAKTVAALLGLDFKVENEPVGSVQAALPGK